MFLTTLAIAISLVMLVRLILLVEQLRKRSCTISYFSNHDVPLDFPAGCPNCRDPVTLPWIYIESPEAHSCPQCEMNFRVSFVPGGVGIAPQYAWEEQHPQTLIPREAIVCDCPQCKGKLFFYVDRRPTFAGGALGHCRACGFSETP